MGWMRYECINAEKGGRVGEEKREALGGSRRLESGFGRNKGSPGMPVIFCKRARSLGQSDGSVHAQCSLFTHSAPCSMQRGSGSSCLVLLREVD